MLKDSLHDKFLQAVREKSDLDGWLASNFAFRRRVRERFVGLRWRQDDCSPQTLGMSGDPLHFEFGQAVPEI